MRIRRLLLCRVQNLRDAGLMPTSRLRTIHQPHHDYKHHTQPLSAAFREVYDAERLLELTCDRPQYSTISCCAGKRTVPPLPIAKKLQQHAQEDGRLSGPETMASATISFTTPAYDA
ncbi:unnamed protein product, partial [Ascophyllum nodosum]